MSVLIKGLTKEKVESCFRFAKDGWCIFDMPEIIEVPTPHGQLIDIEPFMRGLYEEIQMGQITYTSQELYDMIDEEIKLMPTIIESECE